MRRDVVQAFRPLAPRTLLWQLGVLAVAEVLLYRSYGAHAAEFHWATHFLVGLTVAALWRAAFLLVAARPTRFQLLSVLGFHLWAMWPDLVFRAPGVPHYPWMDWVALGHISSHYMPGGDTTWLVIALLASGGYALLLWRWLRARHTEAAAGMVPAVGIGGAAVLRPQGDPRRRELAHQQLGPRDGEPVVLLHGLGASSATWLPTGQRLAQAGHRVLVPDLLGFGASMHLGTVFDLEHQAHALVRLLDTHGLARVHLVGHSWGCAVAAQVATTAPERVDRLALVAPAVFADVPTAKRRFAERSALARLTVEGSPLGGFACGAMCLARPLISRLVPRMEPDVPPAVARDGVRHSYASYADALSSLWEPNPLGDLLRAPAHLVTVVLAEQDQTVLADDVLTLPPSPEVDVRRVPGGHGVAYEQPDLIADLLLAQDRSTRSTRDPC